MENNEWESEIRYIPITFKLRELGIFEIYVRDRNCTISLLNGEGISVYNIRDYKDFHIKLEKELLLTPLKSFDIRTIQEFFDYNTFEKMRISAG